jgi:hypothetical protein
MSSGVLPSGTEIGTGYAGGEVEPGSSSGGSGGGLLGLILAAGSSIYSSIQNRKNTKDTIAANKALAQQQYQYDLDMWNKMNEYNSPASQMARYSAAGLNPNLIYGSGSASAGNASSMPHYQAPRVDYAGRSPLADIPGIISMYQDFKLKNAQIDNVEAATRNVEARTATEGYNAFLREMQGKTADYNLENKAPYQTGILGNQAMASEAKLQQEWQKLKLMKQSEVLNNLQARYAEKRLTSVDIDNEKRQAELLFQKYRNAWMGMGITSSDNVFLRVFARMMNESSLDFITPRFTPKGMTKFHDDVNNPQY